MKLGRVAVESRADPSEDYADGRELNRRLATRGFNMRFPEDLRRVRVQVCSIAGCRNGVRARGLCAMHYQHARRHGFKAA